MGFIASIFGRTKSPWNDILKMEECSEEMKFVIRKFYIADNISLEKYLQNHEVFLTYESQGIYFAKDLPSTPSLLFAAEPLNRGKSIPEWFIVAYPDIVRWMVTNSSSIRQFYKSPYVIDNEPTNSFFRALIQTFLHSGNTLECI